MLLGKRLLGLALEPALKHRELGPQMILFGGKLGDRERKLRLDPAAREPLGAGVEGGKDHEREQGRRQEAKREDHDGFNHAAASSLP